MMVIHAQVFMVLFATIHWTATAADSASYIRASSSSSSDSSDSWDGIPIPFSPPSDEFCQENKLGDDAYFSLFKPCKFVFYTSDATELNHFSCDGVDTLEEVGSEDRKVIMWPESCVANGPRCYDLTEQRHLENYTFFEDGDYQMEFPPEATIVSVDCQEDFATVEQFVENLPEELTEVAESLGELASALAFGVFVMAMGCLAGLILCIWNCCRDRSRTSRPYLPVKTVPIYEMGGFTDQSPVKREYTY